jgi:hypothetical protein
MRFLLFGAALCFVLALIVSTGLVVTGSQVAQSPDTASLPNQNPDTPNLSGKPSGIGERSKARRPEVRRAAGITPYWTTGA